MLSMGESVKDTLVITKPISIFRTNVYLVMVGVLVVWLKKRGYIKPNVLLRNITDHFTVELVDLMMGLHDMQKE